MATRLNTQLTKDTVINPIEPKADLLLNRQQPNTPLTTTESTIQRQSSDGYLLAPSIPLDGQRVESASHLTRSESTTSQSSRQSTQTEQREITPAGTTSERASQSASNSQPSSPPGTSKTPGSKAFRDRLLRIFNSKVSKSERELADMVADKMKLDFSELNLPTKYIEKQLSTYLKENSGNKLFTFTKENFLDYLNSREFPLKTALYFGEKIRLNPDFITRQYQFELQRYYEGHLTSSQSFQTQIKAHLVEISQIQNPKIKEFFIKDESVIRDLVLNFRFAAINNKKPMELVFERLYKLATTAPEKVKYSVEFTSSERKAIRELTVEQYADFASIDIVPIA